MKKEIKILAIETSCDETAAAVISNCHSELVSESTGSRNKFGMTVPVILSSIVSSQADLHAKTGGVVPEVASRAHMECILPVIEEALAKAKSKISAIGRSAPGGKNQKSKLRNGDLSEGITHVAVTNGPGLIGSLLVGFNAAKTIAYTKNLPFIPINHIEGHIYSAFAENQKSKIKNQNDGIDFPILALTVSGGHTSLTLMRDHGEYQHLGGTIDDAAGEAFDKVAKLLNLGYPGGPAVSKYASDFRSVIARSETTKQSEIATPVRGGFAMTIRFPRPLIDKPDFNFSFSGLKTAVLTQVIKDTSDHKLLITSDRKSEICFAFEEAVVDVLCTKTIRAAKKYHPGAVILAGGVAANRRLREELARRLGEIDIKLLMPPIELCGDNAAMIGIAAYYHIVKNNIPKNIFSVGVDSNAELK